MQRAATVQADQVGSIDQGVDRAKPHGPQSRLQPLGRGAVSDASDQSSGKHRTGIAIHLDRDRAGERASHRRDRLFDEIANPSSGKVAGDTVHAQPVGPVRRNLEIDHGFQAQSLGDARTDFQGVRQVHDAVRLAGGFQLRGRTQHTHRDHTTDRLLDQGDSQPRHICPNRSIDRGQARPRIGGTADDFLAAVDGVDLTDPQPVGIRVRHGFNDLGHAEGRQLGRRVGDMLDLKTRHGHGVDNLTGAGRGVEMIFEPGKGELHRGAP